MAADNETIVKTPNQARGAEPGPSVRYVLIGGVALVVVAFAALWLGWFG